MMIVVRRRATIVSAVALAALLVAGALLLALRQAGPTPVVTGSSVVTDEGPGPSPTPVAAPSETPAAMPSQTPVSLPVATLDPAPPAPPPPAAVPTPQEIPDQLGKVDGEPCDPAGAYGRTAAGELLLCAYSPEAERGQWRRVSN